MFGLRKDLPFIDVIESDGDTIKLQTLNGTVNAKKILSISGKHVIYVDQYGNVKEALLR